MFTGRKHCGSRPLRWRDCIFGLIPSYRRKKKEDFSDIICFIFNFFFYYITHTIVSLHLARSLHPLPQMHATRRRGGPEGRAETIPFPERLTSKKPIESHATVFRVSERKCARTRTYSDVLMRTIYNIKMLPTLVC